MNRTLRSSCLRAPLLALLFMGLLVMIHQRVNAFGLVDVSIDAKLMSDPNSFNCGNKGNLPVTIFGSASFDVTTVDLSKVWLILSLDPTFAVQSAPILAKAKASVGDVNSDGFPDLVVYFDSQAVSSAICPLPAGTLVYLKIFGGPIPGCSCIGFFGWKDPTLHVPDVLRISGKK